MLIPIGGVSGTPEESTSRKWLGIYALAMFVCGPVVQLFSTLNGTEPIGLWLGIFAIGVWLYGWVANFAMTREARRY